MTARTPPFVIQAGSHPAEHFREMSMIAAGSPFGAFAGGVSAFDPGHGIGHTLDLVTTQNGTPAMNVLVSGGGCQIRGTENQNQGVYTGYNDASVLLTIAAADPTNPRRDLVVAKVRDAAYSGAANDFSLAVVTGTPAGSPVDPAVPNNALVIARVAVAALAASIVNANITDLRTKSHGSSWNTAWGLVAPATLGSSGGATSGTTATGLLVGAAFTAIANRQYVVSASFDWVGSTIGDVFGIEIRDGSAAGAVLGQAAQRITTISTTATYPYNRRGRPFTLSAASHAPWIVATRLSGTGTLTLVATEQSLFVEDVGPV